MCLKYSTSSLKTQSNDAIYHRLVQVLKFSTIKMQRAHRQSRGLYLGCNVGLKVGGKEVDKCFENCRANNQEDYGTTNNKPNRHEEHQHSNLLQQSTAHN